MTDKVIETQKSLEKFGFNLWKLLNEKQMTREELAELIGLSDARMIYRYESGKTPSFPRAILISKVLDVSLDSMLQ